MPAISQYTQTQPVVSRPTQAQTGLTFTGRTTQTSSQSFSAQLDRITADANKQLQANRNIIQRTPTTYTYNNTYQSTQNNFSAQLAAATDKINQQLQQQQNMINTVKSTLESKLKDLTSKMTDIAKTGDVNKINTAATMALYTAQQELNKTKMALYNSGQLEVTAAVKNALSNIDTTKKTGITAAEKIALDRIQKISMPSTKAADLYEVAESTKKAITEADTTHNTIFNAIVGDSDIALSAIQKAKAIADMKLIDLNTTIDNNATYITEKIATAAEKASEATLKKTNLPAAPMIFILKTIVDNGGTDFLRDMKIKGILTDEDVENGYAVSSKLFREYMKYAGINKKSMTGQSLLRKDATYVNIKGILTPPAQPLPENTTLQGMITAQNVPTPPIIPQATPPMGYYIEIATLNPNGVSIDHTREYVSTKEQAEKRSKEIAPTLRTGEFAIKIGENTGPNNREWYTIYQLPEGVGALAGTTPRGFTVQYTTPEGGTKTVTAGTKDEAMKLVNKQRGIGSKVITSFGESGISNQVAQTTPTIQSSLMNKLLENTGWSFSNLNGFTLTEKTIKQASTATKTKKYAPANPVAGKSIFETWAVNGTPKPILQVANWIQDRLMTEETLAERNGLVTIQRDQFDWSKAISVNDEQGNTNIFAPALYLAGYITNTKVTPTAKGKELNDKIAYNLQNKNAVGEISPNISEDTAKWLFLTTADPFTLAQVSKTNAGLHEITKMAADPTLGTAAMAAFGPEIIENARNIAPLTAYEAGNLQGKYLNAGLESLVSPKLTGNPIVDLTLAPVTVLNADLKGVKALWKASELVPRIEPALKVGSEAAKVLAGISSPESRGITDLLTSQVLGKTGAFAFVPTGDTGLIAKAANNGYTYTLMDRNVDKNAVKWIQNIAVATPVQGVTNPALPEDIVRELGVALKNGDSSVVPAIAESMVIDRTGFKTLISEAAISPRVSPTDLNRVSEAISKANTQLNDNAFKWTSDLAIASNGDADIAANLVWEARSELGDLAVSDAIQRAVEQGTPHYELLQTAVERSNKLELPKISLETKGIISKPGALTQETQNIYSIGAKLPTADQWYTIVPRIQKMTGIERTILKTEDVAALADTDIKTIATALDGKILSTTKTAVKGKPPITLSSTEIEGILKNARREASDMLSTMPSRTPSTAVEDFMSNLEAKPGTKMVPDKTMVSDEWQDWNVYNTKAGSEILRGMQTQSELMKELKQIPGFKSLSQSDATFVEKAMSDLISGRKLTKDEWAKLGRSKNIKLSDILRRELSSPDEWTRLDAILGKDAQLSDAVDRSLERIRSLVSFTGKYAEPETPELMIKVIKEPTLPLGTTNAGRFKPATAIPKDKAAAGKLANDWEKEMKASKEYLEASDEMKATIEKALEYGKTGPTKATGEITVVKVALAQNEPLIKTAQFINDARMYSNKGHVSYWSFRDAIYSLRDGDPTEAAATLSKLGTSPDKVFYMGKDVNAMDGVLIKDIQAMTKVDKKVTTTLASWRSEYALNKITEKSKTAAYKIKMGEKLSLDEMDLLLKDENLPLSLDAMWTASTGDRKNIITDAAALVDEAWSSGKMTDEEAIKRLEDLKTTIADKISAVVC